MIGDIFQPTHLIFIFVVALLVLGPKRLPEVGRSLGKGIRDFRGAMAGIEDQAHGVFDSNETQATSNESTGSVALAAPAPAEGPTVSTETASAAEASAAVPVGATASAPAAKPMTTTPSVTRSGSGFTEPDPDDYAD